jgi:hypothetical protein
LWRFVVRIWPAVAAFAAASCAKAPGIANVKKAQFLVVEARESNNFLQFLALADGFFEPPALSTGSRCEPRR